MKNPKLIIVVFICILTLKQGSILVAQTKIISGNIINGITSKPISGIKIEVKGVNITTISNLAGEYSLTIPDTLKTINFADFEGLEILEIKQVSDEVIDIYLAEVDLPELSLEDLMKIKVVTAGKQEQQISEIPASVVVITRKDIEDYGYQSLKEILSNALGMYKIDDYRNVSFGVRGFFSNVYSRNIVFMINGVKQQTPYLNWNDLNLMNIQVETIESIEFVRGPMAIIYGNDAFFGAINIITHQKNVATKSSATIGYGSDNTYRANIQVNSTNEKVNVNLSAGYSHTDGRDVPFKTILDTVQRYDGVWIEDGTTKDYFKQKSGYLNLSMDHKGFYANLSYDETQRNLIHFFAPVYDTIKLNRNDQIFRGLVGYQKEVNNWLSFNISTSFENFAVTDRYEGMVVFPQVDFAYDQFESQRLNSELIVFIKPISKLNISLGGQYSYVPNGFDLTDIPVFGVDRSIVKISSPVISEAAFLQFEYKIIPRLSFLAGGRIEKQKNYYYTNSIFVGNVYQEMKYSNNYTNPTVIPRLTLVYNLNKTNVLKLMYSQAISQAGIYENSYVNSEPHPLLKPQTITTYELNYNTVELKNLFINTSVFYNQLNNLINKRSYIDPSTGVVVTTNINSDKLETIGAELQCIYKPFASLKFDASLSFQKTNNLLYNNNASYSPNLLAYFKAIYSIKNNVVLSLNSYYIGSMESEWDEIKQERISKTTSGYYNLGGNIRFNNLFKTGLYFSLHAENILITDIYYAPTTINSSYLPKGTYDTGIKLFATLGLKF